MLDDKRYRMLLLAFFLSGLAGLVYEIAWARQLGLIFGMTSYAVASILAVFFTGLGLGSFIVGRLVDKVGKPLRIYAFLELGVGIYALLTPQIFRLIESLQTVVWQRFEPSYAGFSLVTLLFSVAGLILPTTLMGGTLPAMSKFLVRQKETLGERISVLYAINAAGAILGVILAGFVLMTVLGVKGVIYLGAGINILIGVGILVLGAKWDSEAEEKKKGKRGLFLTEEPRSWVAWGLLVAYGFSGLAALSLEVVWTRVLGMILGGSTYAFSVMLVTFLLGIAVGSAVVSRWVDRKENILVYFVVTQILIGVFVILSLPVFGRLPFWFFEVLKESAGSFWLVQLLMFGLCSLVMLMPTLLMGAAFPMVVKGYRVHGLGAKVGRVYGANTIGGVLGSLVAGFLLIPMIGAQKGMVITALVYLVVGGGVLGLTEVRRKVKVWVWLGLMVVGVMGLLMPGWDKNVLNSGVFIYGDTYLKGEEVPIIFYKEGIGGTIAVREHEDGSRFLQIDGKADASSVGDLETELMLGHLGMLLHPKAEEVLVVGLGSGITVGAVEQYDEVVKVDVIEIEPAIVEAAKLFAKDNKEAMDDPRLEMIVWDARHFLLGSERQYDMVTSEPSNPWFKGNASLFTQEFYQLVRNHLKPGGVMVQWIHGYGVSPEDLAMVMRTFRSIFPHMSVWTTGVSMEDFLMVGSEEPVVFDPGLWRRKLGQKEVREDLARIDFEKGEDLLGYFLLDEKAVGKFVGEGWLQTDNYPFLEFSAPKSLQVARIEVNLEKMKELQTSAGDLLVPGVLSEDEVKAYFGYRQKLIEAGMAYDQEDFEQAVMFLEEISDFIPENQKLEERLIEALFEQVKVLLDKGEQEKAMEVYEKILSYDSERAEAYVRWGEIQIKQGNLKEAEERLLQAIELDDSLSSAHMYLGIVYGEREEFDKAEEEFKRAIELNPKSVEAYNNLVNLYRLENEVGKAIEALEKSLEIKPRQPKMQQLLESLRQ